MKPTRRRRFFVALKWIVRKGLRRRTRLGLVAVLSMMFILAVTRSGNHNNCRGQRADGYNCRGQRDYVIVMRNNFLAERYLTNVDSVLRTLFPDEERARSFGDVQMTYMFGPISKSSQSIHSNNRTRTFREASKRVEKQKLSRALRYKQSATTLKSKESSVVADRVRSPSLVTLPGEPKDGRLVSPLLEKQTGATGNELGTSSARLGEVRDPSGEEDKNDDKVRQQSRGNDNQAPMEHPARRDFRLRAQRIAKLCPSLVRNRTEMHRGPTFSEAWEDLETSISKAETAKGVFWHQETRTAYCFVPKAGCTFWIRIFSFLQNFTAGLDAQSPWDLPRLAVHSRQQNPNARGAPLWHLENEVMAPDSLRFLVSRDPFARLWSAYVDKFVLPDFWGHMGIHVVRRFRKNPTTLAKSCGNDVTFSEFIQYALAVRNDHWEPIHKRCDPCRFQPQVVADITSFARDSIIVLRHMGLGHVLQNLNATQQKQRELETLIDFNFALVNSTQHFRYCLTAATVARLLWKAFQINGYLPVQHLYSPGPEETFSVPEFRDHVTRVFRQSRGVERAVRAQKNYFKAEAYRSLSPELLERLRDRYRLDFEFFGYDDSPFTS